MNILEREKISPSTIGLLQYIKLNSQKNEYIQNIIKYYVFDFITDSNKIPKDILEEAGYIKYVKGSKTKPWENIRLSDLGEKILKEMNEKPLHSLSQFTLNYTKSQYERIGADKSYIKGGNKILHYISEFLYAKDSYTEKMIESVIYSYVEQFTYDKKYLNKMGTLFFKPKNVYATKFTLEESPLQDFIENNQDAIRYNYKLLNG